jgi:hypothetical protein
MIRWALAEIRRHSVSTPAAAQLLELLRQHLRIDHHAVSDHAQRVLLENSRRDQVKLPGIAVADDRVAGVVATLKADHRVRPLGKEVGYLTLAFVAPLGADEDYSWHDRLSVRRARAEPALRVGQAKRRR